MKGQLSFYLAVGFSALFIVFMILVFLSYIVYPSGYMRSISSLQQIGYEYKIGNSFLSSSIYVDNYYIVAIDLLAGSYLNEDKYVKEKIKILINNTTVPHYINNSVIFGINLGNDTVGLCVNRLFISYKISEDKEIQICPPVMIYPPIFVAVRADISGTYHEVHPVV